MVTGAVQTPVEAHSKIWAGLFVISGHDGLRHGIIVYTRRFGRTDMVRVTLMTNQHDEARYGLATWVLCG
jgi:hypothetical protein